MILKHLLTTYFTVVPMQAKKITLLYKMKNINCGILESSDVVMTEIFLFAVNSRIAFSIALL